MWPRKLIRAFGVINLALCGLGLYAVAGELQIFTSGRHTDERYIGQAYYTMTAVSLGCLVAMLIGAVYLLRLRRRGLAICNALFGFQVVYFFLITFPPLTLVSPATALEIGSSIAAATGIGNMGTALEAGPVYPIIALIVLNLAYRRLKQAG